MEGKRMIDRDQTAPTPKQSIGPETDRAYPTEKMHVNKSLGAGLIGAAHYGLTFDDLTVAEQAAQMLKTVIDKQPRTEQALNAAARLHECVMWLRDMRR